MPPGRTHVRLEFVFEIGVERGRAAFLPHFCTPANSKLLKRLRKLPTSAGGGLVEELVSPNMLLLLLLNGSYVSCLLLLLILLLRGTVDTAPAVYAVTFREGLAAVYVSWNV